MRYGRRHYLEVVLLDEVVLLLVASSPGVQVVVHDRGGGAGSVFALSTPVWVDPTAFLNHIS